MKLSRPLLARMVGSLVVISLLALNGWLVILNLAKFDRLPAALQDLPGLAEVGEGGTRVGAESADGRVATDGATQAFTADGTLPADGSGSGATAGVAEADDWPGGRGPVPDGAPIPRQVLIGFDGELRVVGSAPSWSVATGLAEAVGARLDRDPSSVGLDVTWHPNASDRLQDGEVVLAEPLRYDAGVIELSGDQGEALTSVASLVAEHPELYVEVIGLVGEDGGGDGEAAVAVGRTEVVVAELAARGLDTDRVVTSIASADPGSGAAEGSSPGSGSVSAQGQVVLRIENVLVFGPGS